MNLQEKYARVLLESCLKIEKEQPLFISYNKERKDFVDIVTNIANELGVTDIYYDESDPFKKYEALKTMNIDELKKTGLWNKEMWNVYGRKNAAFLMLVSEMPGLMKDIDSKKLAEITKYAYETRKEFDELRDKSMLAWTIGAVPTEMWAKELFKEDNAVDILWNKIFEICSINEDNPVKIWDEKINKLKERARKLTECQFKSLKYTSSNGTDFSVDLPNNHKWESGRQKLFNGKEVLVNFPTEEVFTSPDCKSAEGIVYSSKPLSYQDNLIDEFYVKFSKGKVIESYAKVGDSILKEMINICENSNMLGEVALVPYDSPISNTKQVFLETLFDENAACHIALGDSFPECVEDGSNIDKDVLFNEYNLNKCDSHVDFMIGTKDLDVTGITKDGKKVLIFEKGNFSKEFE
jgi:aminopeptidase